MARGVRIGFVVFVAVFWGSAGGSFCWQRAADTYEVPAELLWAIAKVESNLDPAAVNRNRDGTRDVGLMQVNSTWSEVLGEHRWHALTRDPCYNLIVGAWVLRDCLDRYGYSWEGIGCYNATTRSKRAAYARKVIPVVFEAVAKRRGDR